MLLTVTLRILETLFVLGLIGSAFVVVLSGIEDLGEIFTKDKVAPDSANQSSGSFPVQSSLTRVSATD